MRLAAPPTAVLALVSLSNLAPALAAVGGPPVPLVRQGDFVATIGTVTALGNRVAVDNAGNWLVRVSTASETAVLHGGVVAHRVGEAVPAPAGATITGLKSFGVSGAGVVVWTLELSNGRTGIYRGSTLTLQTGSTVLNTNLEWGFASTSTYHSFRHGQPNDNGRILLTGEVADASGGLNVPFVSVVSVDASGLAVSESVRIRTGWNYPIIGSLIVDSVPVEPEASAIDGASGSLIEYGAFGFVSSVGITSACCGNGVTEVLYDDDFTPGPSGAVLTDVLGGGADLNATGGWVAKGKARITPSGASSVRIFAGTGASGSQVRGEGDALAAVAPWTIESIPYSTPIFVTDAGAILWYGNWNNPDTTRDEGIFLDGQILVQEGVTTAAGVVIEALDPAALALSANGRWVVFRGRLAGGVEAALRIDLAVPVTPFCSGDGSATPCPCGNAGHAGKGCDNSFATGGGLLVSTGYPSVGADTLVLSVSGLPATATALYFQGETQQNGGLGVVFGDGLRCAGGTIIRLGTKTSAGGASSFGAGVGSDPLISVRGLVPAGGATRTYQVWYRNAAAFCTPSTFNLTNGLAVVWSA